MSEHHPRKHAELIKAWADGAEIQYRAVPGQGEWRDEPRYVLWEPMAEYRIKPTEEMSRREGMTEDEFIKNLPAFPHEHRVGMTMRDYFAAKAMEALIRGIESGKEHQVAIIPKTAYDMADLMLKVRSQS